MTWEAEAIEEALNHLPDSSCCLPEDRPSVTTGRCVCGHGQAMHGSDSKAKNPPQPCSVTPCGCTDYHLAVLVTRTVHITERDAP